MTTTTSSAWQITIALDLVSGEMDGTIISPPLPHEQAHEWLQANGMPEPSCPTCGMPGLGQCAICNAEVS